MTDTRKSKDITIAKAKGRPMLTWVGKKPPGRLTAFPAQQVERFSSPLPAGEGPGVRAGAADWCDWPADLPRGGLLYHGDNKDVLAHLLANGFRGKVKLIYIDPPFDSGADYVRKVQLRGAQGSVKVDGEDYTLGEQIQYSDIWANDNYLQFMYERLLMLRELLHDDGTLYLHCDSTKGHHLRCLMDEVFGADFFRNEIIWFYENKLGTGGQTFDSFHDTILVYTKSKAWTHNALKVQVKEMKMQPVTQKIEGKRVWLRDEDGKRLYQESSPERGLGDVWTIPIINPVASERSGYPTQKPERLIQNIIVASSNSGDLILDCFSGSGTTAAVAQKLGRRWIGCDINKGAIQTTAKRLQGIVAEQAAALAAAGRQGSLVEDADAPPAPAQLAFSTWRVNDYDLAIQHNEAVELVCRHLGVTRSGTDGFFDGTELGKLVKIIPLNHPLTPLDLEALRAELLTRPEEGRDIKLVSLGIQHEARAWVEAHNGRQPVNRIHLVELRTDRKLGRFIRHEPLSADVAITRQGDQLVVDIRDVVSPAILLRLNQEQGVLRAGIPDWRAQVDCVLIATDYDGTVFNVALSDVPEKKQDYVAGRYQLPAPPPGATVAVKIVDMLGEEVLITAVC